MSSPTSYYVRQVKQKIRGYGQPVVVERRASQAGNSVTTQNLATLPYETAGAPGSVFGQGDVDTANGDERIFLFDGSADIRETVDTILWNGWRYLIKRVNPTVLSGKTILQKAYCARTGTKAS